MGRHHEVVETRGHLVDSHVMEKMFDTILSRDGAFEVEEFQIGRTNVDESYMRMRVEAPSEEAMAALVEALIDMGCGTIHGDDATLRTAERDCCAPLDFYSTTNHRTQVRLAGKWVDVARQRMDAAIVVAPDGGAYCSRLRDLHASDQVVCGHDGIRVLPESKERNRLAFAFMSQGVSSERQVETAVKQTAALIRQNKQEGKRVLVVAGPVVVHTGAQTALASLIRRGFIDAILAGNALGVHDAEAALLGTSLGIRLADGRQAEHGHRNHMRAINTIYHAGGIRQAVENGSINSGIFYECIKNDVPFVLAGSLRDDGPLPDTVTDMNDAQDAYAAQLVGAGLVVCLGSMLHSIATGNMMPSWVKLICVDINPAVVTKVSDRGTGQAIGVVTDVGLFLHLLDRALSQS
ncbi:MAG: TIGR00300 family protein [Bryobacterales bacterium]|nr:TIGR00300 family protein [Bryobacterales bacterium]